MEEFNQRESEHPPLEGIPSDGKIIDISTSTHDADSSTVSQTGEGYSADFPDGFDPSIHAVDVDGRPIYTKSGGFAKKRGRKKQKTEELVEDTTSLMQKRLAIKGTGLFFGLMEYLGEDEGLPIINENFNEFETNMNSLYSVLQKRSVQVSEEFECIINFAGSFLQRAPQPKTSTKIKGFFRKLFKPDVKWKNIFKRKKNFEKDEKEC